MARPTNPKGEGKTPAPRTAKSDEAKTVRVPPETLGELLNGIAEGHKSSREELPKFLQSIMGVIESEKNAISSNPNFEVRSQTYVSKIDELYDSIAGTNYYVNKLTALFEASKTPDYFFDILHRLLFFMLQAGDAFSISKHYFRGDINRATSQKGGIKSAQTRKLSTEEKARPLITFAQEGRFQSDDELIDSYNATKQRESKIKRSTAKSYLTQARKVGNL